MPQIFDRSLRISEVVRRELSYLMQYKVNDPRIKGILITEVQTSRNLARSKVYIRAIDKADESNVMKSLVHCTGFLRHQIGKALETKKIPELMFIFDRAAEQGDRIEALLRAESKTK